jgi:hypothetical protein
MLHLDEDYGPKLQEHATARVLAHLLDDVGALVGGEPVENLRRAFWLELLQDRAAPAQGWLVAELDGPGTGSIMTTIAASARES